MRYVVTTRTASWAQADRLASIWGGLTPARARIRAGSTPMAFFRTVHARLRLAFADGPPATAVLRSPASLHTSVRSSRIRLSASLYSARCVQVGWRLAVRSTAARAS